MGPVRQGRPQRPPRMGLALLLLSASSPAWASYQDGFFGLLALFFSLPACLVVFLLALLLRQGGGFARPGVRTVFMGLVGVPWFVLLQLPLWLGDGLSALLIGVGGGALGLLATWPAWRAQPGAAAPEPPAAPVPRVTTEAPVPPVRPVPPVAVTATPPAQGALASPQPARRWLAAYWIGSSFLPWLLNLPAWLQVGLPLDAFLWALLVPWLVFEGPRWVGAVTLLRPGGRAQPWLAAAVLLAALGVARGWVQGAPGRMQALGLGLLVVDLVAWELGRRLLSEDRRRLDASKDKVAP